MISVYRRCLYLVAAFLAALSAVHGGESRLSCESPVFDFEKQDANTPVYNTFVLRNVGSTPVTISGTKTSCSCTASSTVQGQIAPGGTTSLRVKMDLHGSRGWIRKAIVVECDGKPDIPLFVQGTVTRAVDVLPARMDLGHVERDDMDERYFVVAAATGTPIQVTNLKSDSPEIECRLDPLVHGKAYRVGVRIRPQPGSLETRGSIRVLLDHPDYPFVEVPVTAKIVNEIDVLPIQLFVAGAGADATPRYVLLRKQMVESFRASIVDADPDLNVKIDDAPDGYRVTVTPKSNWRSVHGKSLHFQTNIETMKDITVPITVADAVR